MSIYTQIDDNYDTLEQVLHALIDAGVESTSTIIGIDFTKSNEWTGAKSFNNKSLHHIGEIKNPYEQAVTVIGGTLSGLNGEDNNLIHCFGFGDGVEEVLERYRELVPQVRLAGPTSFAPIIETAIDIVENSGRRYHVLLIFADGQVTRSCDTEVGDLSRQEQETIDAIVKASAYPLSIVLVGVGDGPWDMMKDRDNSLENMRTEVDLAALMELPSQYLAALELQHFGRVHERWRNPLPPPINHQQSPLPCLTDQQPREDTANSAGPSISRLAEDTHEEVVVCPICFENPRNLVFGCGHLTCQGCGTELSLCPICRTPITIRIKIYS
ncbi:hypothetical protein MKW94_010059 [Papaver nudicaule]|uniref:RING-type domain-containing protein n=1 Tax=Papaver nudicaule TaxID=74823 RepID=A0AA41VAH0_PAPNU|nr:hypothetical protein [Papaver nudicaule]